MTIKSALALVPAPVWIGAGAVVAVAIAVPLLARFGKDAGKTVAHAALEVPAGLVYGIGEEFGLPDTSDATVQQRGRDALARGDYFEASKNLPAPEFIAGMWRALTGSGAAARRNDIGSPSPYSINPRDRN